MWLLFWFLGVVMWVGFVDCSRVWVGLWVWCLLLFLVASGSLVDLVGLCLRVIGVWFMLLGGWFVLVRVCVLIVLVVYT